MHYYEVALGAVRYRGHEPLTYAFSDRLDIGQLVGASLRGVEHVGVILVEVTKPNFETVSLQTVYGLPILPKQTMDLLAWMRQFYPAAISSHIQLFLPRALTSRTANSAQKPKIDSAHHEPERTLTDEQQAALKQIKDAGSYLLHGETGSGKTQVYIELARKVIRSHRSVLVLTPEIGLTPQLEETFIETFGANRVVRFHSQMTDSQRRITWLRALQTDEPLIIIGPRSCLFMPLHHIGLIVVDESHETSYKQEQAPYYHALRVAAKLGAIHKAIVIFGSATPTISDYAMTESMHRPIIRMQKRAKQATGDKAEVQIVDMRNKQETNRDAHLSTTLIEEIHQALATSSQILLFINRRGSARIVLCSDCGWQAVCPHCDLALTFHHDAHELRCHICNFVQKSPSSCPNCSNADIVFKSVGTKLIAQRVQKLFPAARIGRFDGDNLVGERISDVFEQIRSGEIDILIGTQLLAKGLDLPKLSLVGVINADASLYIPDYTAAERSYQLLHQVIGRVGRGHRAGKAILQTYTPDNPTLQAAASGSWETFRIDELLERQTFNFPPYVHLMKLSCKRASSASAEKAAAQVATLLETSGLRIQIDGPAPAFHEKERGKYHWQLIIKTKDRNELLKAITLLPSSWSYDIDPVNLL